MKKYFRVHLSTLVVLQFAAAGLVWLNVRIKHEIMPHAFEPQLFELTYQTQGWPLNFYSILESPWDGFGCGPSWNYSALAINVGSALVLILALGGACEFIIRRRKRAAP